MRSRGFTLLELVLVLSLSAVVLAVAAPPLAHAISSSMLLMATADQRADISYALTRMSIEIRESSDIDCDQAGEMSIFRGDEDAMQFWLFRLDANGRLIMEGTRMGNASEVLATRIDGFACRLRGRNEEEQALQLWEVNIVARGLNHRITSWQR